MGERKLKILIADDSVVYRSQIRAALEDRAEIVGTAANGKIALDKLAATPVDLLILDLEMPEMDGLATLRALGQKPGGPKVLVFSSASKRGAEITIEALRAGASDFIAKPGAQDGALMGSEPAKYIRDLIAPKIEALFPQVKSVPVATATVRPPAPGVIWDLFRPSVVVIGSSTGGPTVLESIFSQVHAPLECPIVIAQHMPPVFTAAIAERLAKISGLPAREASDGEALENAIYIAPGNYHTRLREVGGKVRLTLDQEPQINSVRPAVDPLFESAARIFKNKCLGFVLTGMGADGAAGAVAVKSAGGAIVIQDQASCVVFGMPGAVQAVGAYDRIATPKQIVEIFHDKIAITGGAK